MEGMFVLEEAGMDWICVEGKVCRGEVLVCMKRCVRE